MCLCTCPWLVSISVSSPDSTTSLVKPQARHEQANDVRGEAHAMAANILSCNYVYIATLMMLALLVCAA